MKKLIALILAFTFIFTLAACGGDKKPNSFENALEEGKYYYEQKDYLTAIETLKTIYAVDPLYKEAKALIDEISVLYVDEILVEVDNLVKEDRFVDALNLLNRARATLVDKKLTQTYEETAAAFSDSIRGQLDATLEEGGYKKVEENISELCKDFPNDTIKEELLEEYRIKACKYIGLDITTDVPYDVKIEKCPVKNAAGTEYLEGCAITYEGNGSMMLTFELGRKYSTLCGIITVSEETPAEAVGNASVSILNVGSTLWSNNKVNAKFEEKEFQCQISSVDKLTIRIKNAISATGTVKPMVVGLYVI